MNKQKQQLMTFGSILDDLFNGHGGRIAERDFFPTEWLRKDNVPVNLTESNDAYSLEVVAPGVSKEDIKINVQDDILTVSFAPQKTTDQETTEPAATEPKVLKHEFELRAFRRSFRLGEKVNIDKIGAQYKNGILYLTLPKKEAEQAVSKTIQID